MRLLLFIPLMLSAAACTASEKVFHFREPRGRAYVIAEPTASIDAREWISCRAKDNGEAVEFTSRIVLQIEASAQLPSFLAGRALTVSRQVAPDVFILQAGNALMAMNEAERLGQMPDVIASHCVSRRGANLDFAFGPRPNDTFYNVLFPLENRGSDGYPLGFDLNARGAWAFTRGAGVNIAIADLGVELNHPDLSPRLVANLHHNFDTGSTNGAPAGASASWAHGTEVAGLAAAEANNALGMSGIAPQAGLASWVIFGSNLARVSDEKLMDAFTYASNTVAVQNHSWTSIGFGQAGPTMLERIGISNAITFGRNGRGVVMVRSAGNDRARGANVNDDGFPSDPRVIAAGAVRIDGRVASYSEPGACVLVATTSGDTGYPLLFTTDLVGTRGVNQINFPPPNQNYNDYAFNILGFSGTSASAPLVSGIAAMMLSANTNLSYRDVQQILIHASRHVDLADPDLTVNGAGFAVSHNVGFGIPDAGWAVRLARAWSNRPPLVTVTLSSNISRAIPDGGFRLLATGDGVPMNLQSIVATPGTGPHPDDATALVPLVHAGLAWDPLESTCRHASLSIL